MQKIMKLFFMLFMTMTVFSTKASFEEDIDLNFFSSFVEKKFNDKKEVKEPWEEKSYEDILWEGHEKIEKLKQLERRQEQEKLKKEWKAELLRQEKMREEAEKMEKLRTRRNKRLLIGGGGCLATVIGIGIYFFHKN